MKTWREKRKCQIVYENEMYKITLTSNYFVCVCVHTYCSSLLYIISIYIYHSISCIFRKKKRMSFCVKQWSSETLSAALIVINMPLLSPQLCWTVSNTCWHADQCANDSEVRDVHIVKLYKSHLHTTVTTIFTTLKNNPLKAKTVVIYCIFFPPFC